MELKKIASRIDGRSIKDQLIFLAELFPGEIVFTTSFGVEDQVIVDFIFANNIPIDVVTLDTGRMFEETYKVYYNTQEKYKKKIVAYHPERDQVEDLLSKKGPFSFYDSIENRKECCYIRKVVPLGRALKNKRCWITGIRADQSEGRTDLTSLEYDKNYNIIKFHPIFDWSLKDVENYLEEKNIPYNELHHKGFISVGCAPCTRAVKPGENFRSGRWWWENNSGKECGLHSK